MHIVSADSSTEIPKTLCKYPGLVNTDARPRCVTSDSVEAAAHMSQYLGESDTGDF